MAFKTKPILSDRQVIQPEGETLQLSGTTDFKGIIKIKGVEIDVTDKIEDHILTYDGDKIILANGINKFRPVANRYENNNNMIIDQPNQKGGYIYYDGEVYWEYLGTTNGNISDYNDIGGIPSVYVELTYAELTTLASNNELLPGTFYLITDYQTIHLIPNTTEINTAPIEELVVFAISENKIGSRVYSLLYPKDIIEYDFSNAICEDNITPRKGKIEFRHDISLDTYAYYDFRHAKWRRWKILAKQEETIIKLTENTFESTFTFTSFVANTLNLNRRFHVKFEESITHDAGVINLTIKKGAVTVTRPLIKWNGTPWTANELSNTAGIISNCNVRNVYVYFNYRQFGKEILNTYSARTGASVYTIGDGLRYDVDVNDFQDYFTFNSTYYGVHMERTSQKIYNQGPRYGNNNIFLGAVDHITMDTHCTDNIFRVAVINAHFGSETIANVFSSNVRWSNFTREVVTCYFGNIWHGSINDHIINTTLYGPDFHIISDATMSGSTVAVSGNMAHFHQFIENSMIATGGAGGGNGRTYFSILGGATSSLIGWFNADGVILLRRYINQSEWEPQTNQSIVDTLRINNLITPTGEISLIGVDEKGNLVDASSVVPTGILSIQGSLASYGNLPSDLTLSDYNKAYFVEADGKLYIWNGTSFPTNGNGITFQGPAGTNGRTILNGTVDPTTEGVDGDFYINTTTDSIFGPKTAGVWGLGLSLVGPQGIQGPAGEGVSIEGSVPAYINLPSGLGPADSGKAYFVSADGKLYIWDGTQFPTNGNGITFQGPQGIQGIQGVAGTNGKTILNGTVNPTIQGVDGDFYINTTTTTIFGPKTAGSWGSGILLIGPQGNQGIQGIQGVPGPSGKTILNGVVDPTTEGVDGDFYINTATNTLFGPKTAGVWGTGTSLVGPQGNQGIQGIQGIQGVPGTNGKTILNGVVDPTTQGVDGDFYVNTVNLTIFGPKTAGVWGSGTSLVGPAGSDGYIGQDGADGVDGRTVLSGTIDPVDGGSGISGDFYINTTTWTIFGPKVGPAWGSGTSLVGPQGIQGPAGSPDTASEIRDKLQTLVGVNRLDASAIKNLPAGEGGINYFNTEIINQTGGVSSTYASLTGLIDGINTTYTVSEGVYVSGSLQVYLNGQLQTQGVTEDWIELSPSGGTFQFIEAPISGDVITVIYNDIETTLATLLKTTDVKNSIQVDAGSLQLVNDQLAPGNDKLYGTNELGVKGWINNGPIEIVAKLESIIVEEDKLDSSAIKEFINEVDNRIDIIIPDANPSQFNTISGFTTLISKFTSETAFTVSFATSSEHGSEASPIYYYLGITLDGARNENKTIIYHSSLLVPSILVANKPTSPKAVYNGLTNPTSPLSIYANEAAMLAGQSGQVLNSYYYYTGSNTAWRYNGIVGGLITNYTPEIYLLGDQSTQVSGQHYAYSGSTSMWLYNGVATGVIGNYTEIVAIPGWQEWGTRPDYLTVTGDAYLVGQNNLNQLSFIFYKYISGQKNRVVCTNQAISNGNEQILRPDLRLAVWHRYNENDSPVLFDSIINNSFYGSEMVTEIINPNGAVGGEVIYEPLGPSGNFSIFMGRFSSTSTAWNNFTQRGYRILEYNDTLGRLALGEKMTIISRLSFPSGTYSAQDKIILECRDANSLSGFGFRHITDGRLEFRMYFPTGQWRTIRTSTGSEIPLDSGFWCVAGVYDRVSPTEVRCRFYRKSIQNSVASQFIQEVIDTSGEPIKIYSPSDFSFDRTGTASTGRPKKEDEHRLYFDALTESEIFTIFNEIDIL